MATAWGTNRVGVVMVLDKSVKPIKLVIDSPTLARWLTSNPQRDDPAKCLAVICPTTGILATPWPIVTDDHKDQARQRPRATPPFDMLRKVLKDTLTGKPKPKLLPPPRPDDPGPEIA